MQLCHHALWHLCYAPAGVTEAVTTMQLSQRDVLFSPGSKADNMYIVLIGKLSYEAAAKPGLSTTVHGYTWGANGYTRGWSVRLSIASSWCFQQNT